MGKTLPGFASPAGSKRARSRCIAARSASPNISGIEHALSVPTPCSPVIEPPASTQASRISLASSLRPVGLALDALVVEDERVQVAVAGVEDVADAEAVLALELGDPAQHLGQPRPRHDAVLHVVVGLTRPIAAKADLRPLQSSARSSRVGRDADLAGAGRGADRLHRGEVVLDLRGDAVQLDDQHRAAPSG